MNTSRLEWVAGGLALLLAVAVGGCRESSQRVRGLGNWLGGKPESIHQYYSAKELFERGRYGQAAVGFRAWLADYHDSQDVLRPFVLYQLAECYRHTRDYERAARAYKTVVEMYTKSPHSDVRDLVEFARLRLDDIGPAIKPRPGGPEPAAKD